MNVSIATRTNSDGSVTYYLRYMGAEGREVRKRCLRSEPKANKTSLRGWMRDAHVAAAKFQRELENPPGRSRRPIVHLSLVDGLQRFLEWGTDIGPGGQQNRAEGTLVNIERHCRAWMDWLGGLEKYKIREMGQAIRYHFSYYRDYLLRERLAPGTVNLYLASLGAWFAWGVDHSHCWRNEVREVVRVRAPSRRAEVSLRSAADLKALLGKVKDATQRAYITILAGTGLRQGEAKALRWADWDSAMDTLTVQAGRETTKRHDRVIPLPDLVSRSLDWLGARGEGPFILGGSKALSSQLNRWLRPHGVSPHDCRRYYITALESIGAPKTVIDDLVGHSPGKVRGAYTPGENLEATRPWIRKFQAWLEGGE